MNLVFKFSLSIFRRTRYWWLAALLAFVLLPVLGLLVAPAFLCVAAPTQKADVIILLGGEDGSRVEGAAALFNAGWAPHVIITGEDDMYRRELIHLGVPKTSIWVDALARSTAENARFSIRIMRANDCKSALLVTSWYHTRRARNCFNHYGPGLAFYAQPTHQSAAVAKNWGSPATSILKEYPKAIWYWFRYGVSPF
jgi:uncharacterized SAM-binding protein YcdF (DUF218 family)